MHNFAWELHDNSVEDWFSTSSIDRLVQEWIGKEPTAMSLPEYVYWGGLIQGEGLHEYIDNFRRRKFQSGSAIFWMYNDCWPATRSWTVVDYELRRTPSFYPVRRAFTPVAVVLAADDERVQIYGINDRLETWRGELEFGLLQLNGKVDNSRRIAVEIAGNSSCELATIPMAAWEQVGVRDAVAYAALWGSEGLVARNRLFLVRFRELNWLPVTVQVERDGDEVVFSSSAYAWGVAIDLSGEAVGDNFFDVWPHLPLRIPWLREQSLPSVLFVGNLVGER
jgi:beta-mannosidase